MNLHEIKDNAPDGATHCDRDGNYYLGVKKHTMTLWYQWVNGEWQAPKSMFLNIKPL